MRNGITVIIERDGPWFVAYSPEIPGASGQGRTKAEARQSRADAIALNLEDRRREGPRGLPRDALREKVVVVPVSAMRLGTTPTCVARLQEPA